jgi:indolepyruvate ferredoxin oxidoreductase alpha subunit
MSGNEGIARGAYEAGVTVATGYPGTPSTEILEAVVQYKDEVFCQWSPNEKVALEVSAGASLAGARTICTMKHVGLNVAADPLMNLSYIGTEGGLVVCVADDPGQHSSQNEQDTRHYARLAKIPVFEPADSQEAKDFVALAMDISERFRTPVILRSTTRVSHSRSLVSFTDRRVPAEITPFVKDPPRHVPIPVWGRVMRKNVEDRIGQLAEAACESPANRTEWRDRSLGIITHSIPYQYVRDTWPNASVLKLGWAWPFPDELIREFAEGVEQLLVVEELDDILEQHVKAMGLACRGKDVVPRCGELTPTVLAGSRAKLDGSADPADALPAVATDLPARPPVLCAGCPHRGVFFGLNRHDVVVTGDIGCYSLGVFEPLDRMDVILCMGGGVSMTQGFEKAGEPKKVVGIVGDSTFFHSGVTGLMDIAYNKGTSTIIVVDNRTTAMTGHQDHPGTGRTLMGEPARELSVTELARACGFARVREISPYDVGATARALDEEIAADEPSLIVSLAACPLHQRQAVGPQRSIDHELCRDCGKCLKLGCPAIEGGDGKPVISTYICGGCGLCQQVCPFHAIEPIAAVSE